MEVAEVQDKESLKRYLTGLPEEERLLTARRVAFRAAARVLPAVVRYFAENQRQERPDLTALPIFGACSIGGLAAVWPNPPIARAASAASAAYAAASARAASARPASARAASATASAASAASAAYAAYAIASAAYATASAADAADATASAAHLDVWDAVRADLTAEINTPKARLTALWVSIPCPDSLRDDWQVAKQVLSDDPSADWSFWIAWYERVLSGRDFLAAEMAEVLNTLGEDHWKKGPAHVNPMFDGVLAKYRAQDADQIIAATPLGEDVTYDEENAVLVLRATDIVEHDYLVDVIGQIASACRLFAPGDINRNNFPLTTELRILEEAQTIHRDRPVLILKDVSRVLTRLAKKIAVDDCPSADQDADIGDFQEILENVQLDLIGLSPEVKAYHQATRPAVPEEDVTLIAEGARAVAQSGDQALVDALTSEAAILEDTEEDEVARRNAFYRITGLVTRSYRAVRPVLKEGAAVATDSAKVGGAIAAVGGGVAYLISPAFREFLETVIRSFL